MTPLIELRDVTRSYIVGGEELKVLKGINLKIEEGEFVAIMGPSGSGKSTMMQILGLLDRPTSGTYLLFGRDVSRLTDDEGAALRSRTIGFIFQMFNLLARTTALDNVILPMIYAGLTGREEKGRAMLARVGLSDRLYHRPNELSGGQQQRVAVARALINSPRIIFADEPTGNIASDQAAEIMRELQSLNRSGITVILVTHESDIAAYAGRIIHIKDGRIISDEVNEAPLESAGGTAVALAPAKPKAAPAVHLKHQSLTWAEVIEYWQSALRATTANKVRSFLSVLGILIGVAAVIAMLAVGKGAQKAIEERLASLGSNLLMLIPGSPNRMGVHLAEGSSSRLTMEDVTAVAHLNPYIVAADGNVSGGVQVAFKDQNYNTQLTGATPLYASMRASEPYYGRFFTWQENLHRARVALIGQTVANELFAKDNPVGQFIKINRVNYRVIGILPMKGAAGPRDQDDMILVPLQTAMKRILGDNYLSNIGIQVDAAEHVDQTMVEVHDFMRHRHHLAGFQDDDFQVRNMADIRAALEGTTKTFSLLLGIVAAISLLVGGIGIMNIMLVSVSERTREIGLRKAVGAARRAILIQFLMESAVLSILGGVAGIILGVTVSMALSTFAGWAAIVQPQAIAMAFVFSAGVGVLFGFWPARKASLLSPIEALRYE